MKAGINTEKSKPCSGKVISIPWARLRPQKIADGPTDKHSDLLVYRAPVFSCGALITDNCDYFCVSNTELIPDSKLTVEILD